MLPAQCRWAGHEPGAHESAVMADHGDVVGPGSLDRHDDVGMRSLDLWSSDRRGRPGVVVATVPDAPAFRVAAADETDGEILGPPYGCACCSSQRATVTGTCATCEGP